MDMPPASSAAVATQK